jgi:CRP-like cAMP-binding protein
MAKGKKHGVGSGYNMLGPGDVFGEIAFFTEVPQLEVRGLG